MKSQILKAALCLEKDKKTLKKNNCQRKFSFSSSVITYCRQIQKFLLSEIWRQISRIGI